MNGNGNKLAVLGTTLVATIAIASTAYGQCSSGKATARQASNDKPSKDIVQTAVGAGSFNTLVAALKEAELVEALQGKGPFTVFAPTDEAFAKLPKGTVEKLLKPENRKQLQAILTYHVVPGKLDAKHVIKRNGANTLNGQRLDFSMHKKNVMIDSARVVKADIETSNGVIHVIDTVMLPSAENLVETAASAKQFTTLLIAAKKAGLADALAGEGPFTIFAPTDEAFAKLPEGTIEKLLQPENRDQLATILKYHVVSGRVYSDAAIEAGRADTLAEKEVRIRNGAGGVTINDAQVVRADLDASNGVIHVIDRVILPN